MRTCRPEVGLLAGMAIACGGPENGPASSASQDEAAARNDDLRAAERASLMLAHSTTTVSFAPPDEDAAPFASCSADADCIAVPKVGCCHIGWKAAVNKNEADAYQNSFQCPVAQPVCIRMYVRDRRLPRCNPEEQRCELVDEAPASCK